MADLAMTVALAKALGGGGGGGGGGVSDVKVNGTSVVNDGVANVPMASKDNYGAVRVDNSWPANGIVIITNGQADKGKLQLSSATDAQLKAGVYNYPVITSNQHKALFFALSKLAGENLNNDTVTIGTYPEKSKSAISQMLNAPETVTGSTPSIAAKSGVQYICGEVSTIDITVPETGIIDVIFESGSTPAVLTVTPPTGKTMKWAGGFDPTSLEANTTYEINIMNGCLGVAGSWT